MVHHDVVVIGASAGGIQALMTMARLLPATFPAALFIVVHVPAVADSRLPELLSRVGPLPAVHAEHGMVIEPGRIYVAPPDRHIIVRPRQIELSHGPRENHCRPAIDPLFRSAARAFGPRVVGIVLSGALYDGSLGLVAIKARGGVVIVQDPADAPVSSMPERALEMVDADYIRSAADIAPTLISLVQTTTGHLEGEIVDNNGPDLNAVIAEDFAEQASNDRAEETTGFTCPECGGVLWQEGAGSHLAFRCHVGHAYGPELLLSDKAEEFEAALWASLRLLKEKATLSRQLAIRSLARHN